MADGDTGTGLADNIADDKHIDALAEADTSIGATDVDGVGTILGGAHWSSFNRSPRLMLIIVVLERPRQPQLSAGAAEHALGEGLAVNIGTEDADIRGEELAVNIGAEDADIRGEGLAVNIGAEDADVRGVVTFSDSDSDD